VPDDALSLRKGHAATAIEARACVFWTALRFGCAGRPEIVVYAAPPASTAMGSACDRLSDRGVALGSPRADRGAAGGRDPVACLQTMACRARRHVVASDD